MLFIEDGAPVIVQGMTGHQGMTHTARMLKAGTNIVGGVNPRKAGTSVTFPGAKNGADANIPVFATCGEAREATGAKASVVFVPPKFAKSAVVEAVEAGIELIVVITEGIPVADSAYFVELALKKGVRIIGPNCLVSSRSATPASIWASSPTASSAAARSDWSPNPAPSPTSSWANCPISASPHVSAPAATRSSARRCWKPCRHSKPTPTPRLS